MNNGLTIEELIARDNEILRTRLEPLPPLPHPPSSGLNEELLKQAIADTKAVCATALANAKAALEEAFREKF